jgi:hypothetical protein
MAAKVYGCEHVPACVVDHGLAAGAHARSVECACSNTSTTHELTHSETTCMRMDRDIGIARRSCGQVAEPNRRDHAGESRP